MGLEASLMSGKDLYKLLCAEGTDDLSANELCTGVAELKGNATSLNMALLQRDQLKIKELMDQMCMSMVKLQGRLQFSQARAGDGGSASSSSSSSSDEASEESADPVGPPVPSAAGGKVVTLAKGPERRRSLNAWMQQRRDQRGTAVKRTTQVGAVSQALFNKDNEDLMPEAKRKFDMKLRAQLAKVVLSFPFEVAFGALICANTIVMAFQSEYNGLETGPLYTPCTWEPESTTDEDSVEFVDPEGLQQNLVDIVDLEAPAPLLPLSRPTPETVLLKARPKGPKQPSYPPPKPAGPKQPDYPPPAKGSLGVRPSSSSSATSSVPKPSAAPKVAIRPAVPKVAPTSAVPKAAPKVPVPKVAPTPAVPKVVSKVAVPKAPVVDPASTAPKTPPKRAPVIDLEGPSASSSVSVRSFVPINQRFLRGVEAFSFNDRGELRQRFLETVGTLGQEGRVIAIDWHQVSDTWRLNRREAARADQHTGALPRQVIEFYDVVKQNLQRQDRLIILSHIERSERNR
eukprot:symbB.v1.2.040465.t1/scaffold7258.1/size12300/1